ncbi:isochorismatase family protein [Leptolyngbya sp. FACHB-711]|uniref:isochorismatase family protein n=1 Tax=unclassified Leptolyngbya TaxID=2650499 RepID=UPI001688E0C2|nr:isochorismatase family protein [Leptolyngbya sp. FACHB-711]MBD1853712.1 isochorismatase family protein [Cyanobacteria bacterium FACHB-502]MBD2023874.1 isochorismatase family protein [Leptolyngbya sp. FACHB-711]
MIGKDCFQISFPPFRLFKQRQQLVDYLCDHQLQQVAVVGIDTDMCVLQIAMDLWRYGFVALLN